LSSIINSVGTLVSVDFYQKLARSPDEKTAVRIAEWSGVMVGVVGIAIALLMSRYDSQSLFGVSIELAGLLAGGFAGVDTVGVVGIAIALLMSRYDIQSLFDVSIELAGLLGGGFAGAYTLGMFTRRANSPGVAIGVAGSIVITLACWWMDLVHPYFYLAISI